MTADEETGKGHESITVKSRKEAERTRSELCKLVQSSPLTQEAIAEKIGLDDDNFDLLLQENGPCLTYRRLFQILEAVGSSPAEFFGSLYGFPILAAEVVAKREIPPKELPKTDT